jgi:hypothetical protein
MLWGRTDDKFIWFLPMAEPSGQDNPAMPDANGTVMILELAQYPSRTSTDGR